MNELNERLTNEIINALASIETLPVNDQTYKDAVQDIKVLSDVKIELDKLDIERERIKVDAQANDIKEQAQDKDRKMEIVKTVLTVGGTIGIVVVTIFAEEIGGKVIRSKAFQWAGKFLPKV